MRSKIIIILVGFIGIYSCQKNELNKPTDLNFIFESNKDTVESSLIKINTTDIVLSEFFVTGKRVEGPDINFTRPFSSPVSINMDDATIVESLKFDVPQGNYEELVIGFKNDNNISPSINVTGKYKPISGPTVRVVFELAQENIFNINCNPNDSEYYIVLHKNISETLIIELNCANWFNNITASQLESADLTIGNSGQGLGNSTILINSTNNIPIFNLVLNNINKKNKVSFQ